MNEITEGRVWSKATRGRRRIQMLYDLANMVVCCTQMGSWGQRGMETDKKDSKTCCIALLMMIMMMMYLALHLVMTLLSAV